MTPKQEKRGKRGKTLAKLKYKRKPKHHNITSLQNPETIISYQGPSCLSLASTKTPGIIINRAL
jgi:hypothetical protein